MSLPSSSHMAAEDFRRARRQGSINDIVAWLTGRSNDLLSYEEVRQKLRAKQGNVRTLQDIPLAAIVGSVGRYTDFTRDFMPRIAADSPRWTRVHQAMEEAQGVPPIEVYQLGDAYFVVDGNHRVSIARQLGSSYIQAYVTTVQTRVPFRPGMPPDQLIVAAEHASFLEQTDLDRSRPASSLHMTVPGHYGVLEEEVEQVQQDMELLYRHDVSFQDAAVQWYDTIYMAVVNMIRQRCMLRDFPNRTEADLYAWIAEHRNAISETMGWDVPAATVAADMVSELKPQPASVTRLGERLIEALTPEALEPSPTPGGWRTTHPTKADLSLFNEILVPINGQPEGWMALEQAIIFAQQEHGRIYGLHVVPSGDLVHSAAVQELRREFAWRCQVGAIDGRLGVEVGTISERIAFQARLASLVVLNLAHPPGRLLGSRLRSGLRAVIQHSPCPVLAVPGTLSYCQRMLLSFDGSPKSKEALFVSSYLADQWKVGLTVLTIADNQRGAQMTLDEARAYLEAHYVNATYLWERGAVADAILQTARMHGSDLVLMGGYGLKPVLEMVVGSTVDQVFRESMLPTLVCQ